MQTIASSSLQAFLFWSFFATSIFILPEGHKKIIGGKVLNCVFLLMCTFLIQIYNFQWNDLISHFGDLLWHKVNYTSLQVLFTVQSSLL